MSVKQTNDLWQRECEPRRKHLLHAICDCADDDGRAFPSVNYLVWKSDLPRSTVIQYMQEFRQRGVIKDAGMRSTIEKAIVAHSERDTKVVWVQLDKLPAKKLWREKRPGASPAAGPGESSRQPGVVRSSAGASPVAGHAIRKNHQEPSKEPSVKQHAFGALQHWLAIKNKLRAQLSEQEFQLWVRPLFLLKVMHGNTLLLALPPNGRIVEAARNRADLLRQLVSEAGHSGFALTKYPDDYERERLQGEHPEFFEQMFGKGVGSKIPAHAVPVTHSNGTASVDQKAASANR